MEHETNWWDDLKETKRGQEIKNKQLNMKRGQENMNTYRTRRESLPMAGIKDALFRSARRRVLNIT